MSKPEDVRLSVILAREAAEAVVLRRGPSRQVLLLRWNTKTDEIEEGQWLKGRIYERRCDLSPDGRLLVYFAASYRKPYYSWSAVSRPPFLTALALWPKGDAWGGGGHFATARELRLNHRSDEVDLAPEFSLPKSLQVVPFGKGAGRGEDDPIWFQRLSRDGWLLTSSRRHHQRKNPRNVWIEFDPPMIWERPHPLREQGPVLRMLIRGIRQTDGPWYVIDHEVVDRDGTILSLGPSDWADWLPNGDLGFARRGSLYRQSFDGGGRLAGAPSVVAELAALTFRERKAPASHLDWP